MNDKRKILFIIIAIILIIVMYIIISNISKKSKFPKEDDPLEADVIKVAETKGKFQEINNLSEYYTLKACIDKFYSTYSGLHADESEIVGKMLFDMLDQKYIDEFDITLGNLKEKLPESKESVQTINKVMYITEYEGIYMYLINGSRRIEEDNSIIEFDMIVIMDRIDNAFSVLLEDYVKLNNYKAPTVGESIRFEIPKKIIKNTNNAFGYIGVSYNDYALELFNQFRSDLIYNRERAYMLLDEDFKERNFPSYEEFNNYINNNQRSFYLLKFGSYTTSIESEILNYICMDLNGEVYVTFKPTSTMQYKYTFKADF